MRADVLMLAAAAAALAVPAYAAPEAQPKPVSPLEVQAGAKPPPADVKIESSGGQDDLEPQYVFWPATAYSAGINGSARLRCVIDVHGLAERCEVASETPAGKGFGKAALELRATFQVPPLKGPDGPISAVKTIEVNFKAPERNFNQGEIAKGQTFNQGNALRMNKVVMIDFPVWTSAPSFDDLARAYPAKAGSEEGYSVVQCHVHSDGVLSGCGVIKEAPEKHDFGKAALALAPHFRIEPRLAQGHGGTPLVVNIPMRFPPREEIAQRTVMAPAWINGFDQKQVPKLFPPEAAASGLTTGRGVARCTVAADGRLTDCAPEPGAPDGLGFSEAAVKLASAMKMNLWSADAEPVEGGVIHIPIRLNLKPDVKAQ